MSEPVSVVDRTFLTVPEFARYGRSVSRDGTCELRSRSHSPGSLSASSSRSRTSSTPCLAPSFSGSPYVRPRSLHGSPRPWSSTQTLIRGSGTSDDGTATAQDVDIAEPVHDIAPPEDQDTEEVSCIIPMTADDSKYNPPRLYVFSRGSVTSVV